MTVPRFTLCASTSLIASTLIAAIVISAPSVARAGFTVTFQQVGTDVVATGSGSLNLTALTYVSNFNVTPRITPAVGIGTGIFGPAAHVDRIGQFGQVAGPGGFGTGGTTLATSAIGDTLAIRGQASQGLYIGGTSYANLNNLSNTTTWANKTISGLGITPGTYTWIWGSGATADYFRLTTAAVPEPGTFVVWGGMGLVGLGVVALRKKYCGV